MANIAPEEIDAAARRGHAAREIETLELLELRLSSEYTVYHGVHWARAGDHASVYGEIDFIVVNRLGRAIAIEQKNGAVTVGADDLVKHYPGGAKGLHAQVTRNLNQLRSKFADCHPRLRLDIDHLFYLPDHVASGPLPSSIDPARAVDARERERLATRITQILEEPSGYRRNWHISIPYRSMYPPDKRSTSAQCIKGRSVTHYRPTFRFNVYSICQRPHRDRVEAMSKALLKHLACS